MIELGKKYKHNSTGEVKTVLSIVSDKVYFTDKSWCNKDIFDDNWKLCEDTSRVEHPSYYQDPSGVECITVARHRDFNIGNALKYLWRAGLKTEEGMSNKDKRIEDLEKAIFYINDEIKMLKDDRFT